MPAGLLMAMIKSEWLTDAQLGSGTAVFVNAYKLLPDFLYKKWSYVDNNSKILAKLISENRSIIDMDVVINNRYVRPEYLDDNLATQSLEELVEKNLIEKIPWPILLDYMEYGRMSYICENAKLSEKFVLEHMFDLNGHALEMNKNLSKEFRMHLHDLYVKNDPNYN